VTCQYISVFRHFCFVYGDILDLSQLGDLHTWGTFFFFFFRNF